MEFEADLQHAPMSGLDEYLIHNHPLPVRVMWTSDPRSYERVWFTTFDPDGEMMLATGMAFYPYLDTAEAYAIVNHGGRHTTVRAHRRLGQNRMDLRVGPFTFEVVQPFREWRLRLDENAFGISYDINWFDTKRSEYRNLGAQTVAANRVFDGVAGYEGFGHQTGTVTTGDTTITLEAERHRGSRDHHWGTRDGVGGRANFSGHTHLMSGLYASFDKWALFCSSTLENLGSSRRRGLTVQSQRYRLDFEDDTRLLRSGEADIGLSDGRVRHLTFERLGNQIAFLRCAMYGGPNGGTPDGDLWQGMYVGDDVVGGETYDANDAAVRARICGLDEMVCRVECDGETVTGLVEAYNPLAYDAAVAGRAGLSLLNPIAE